MIRIHDILALFTVPAPRLVPVRIRTRQRGNIFAMLFGAVALTGVLAAVGMQTLTGPVTTITRVTQKNMAETNMLMNAKIISNAVPMRANNGDTDLDDIKEAHPFRNAPVGMSTPANGGLLPSELGLTLTDPWGTPYGYCVWDHGLTTNGTGYIPGDNTNPTSISIQPFIAIISAGPDREFQTGCPTFSPAATEPMNTAKADGSDDLVLEFTYDGASAAANGLWTLDAPGGNVAQLKDAANEVAVSIDRSSGMGSFTGLTADTIVARDEFITVGGGLKLDTEVGVVDGLCTATSGGGIVRFNAAQGEMEICNGAGEWVALGKGLWETDATETNVWRESGMVGIGMTAPARTLDVAGSLGATGPATLGSSLDVTGTTALGDTLTVTGATSLASTLGVTGDTTLAGQLGVTGAATLSSTLDVAGNTDIDGTLGVAGATTLADTLGVTGATSLSSTLDVTGNTQLNGTLGVFGATTLSDTLDVTGAATLSDTLGVTGAASLASTLSVVGNTNIAAGTLFVDALFGKVGIGTVTPASKLDVDGGIKIGLQTSCSAAGGDNGAIQYDNSIKKMQVCIDGTWSNVSSIEKLDDIGDVEASAPLHNEILAWNDSDKRWEPKNINLVGPAQINPAGNDGSIQFKDGSDLGADADNLHWDNDDKRLGVGTDEPTHTLNVVGDSSLVGALAVSGAANLSSTLDVLGNLTVDNGTLFVDATNNSVGIGTITPRSALDVMGGVKVGNQVDCAAGGENNGTLRYNTNQMQMCLNGAWSSIQTGEGGGMTGNAPDAIDCGVTGVRRLLYLQTTTGAEYRYGFIAGASGIGMTVAYSAADNSHISTTNTAGWTNATGCDGKDLAQLESEGRTFFLIGGSGLSGLVTEAAGSANEVQYRNPLTGAFAADASFVWDDVNKRLGVGTTSPQNTLDIRSPNSATIRLSADTENDPSKENANPSMVFMQDGSTPYFQVGLTGESGSHFAGIGPNIPYLVNRNDTGSNRTLVIGVGHDAPGAWIAQMVLDKNGRIGVGTINPNASALLDLSATDKGLLPPRVTTAQRDAIATPAAGLMVYNSTTNRLNLYTGSSWIALSSGISDGTYGDIEVTGAGSVWTVRDGRITTVKINDGAVTAGKLADGAVTEAKLDANAVSTAKIADGAVSFVKMQDVASNILLGRASGGTGVIEEIELGDGLVFDAGKLSVTGGGGSGVGDVEGPASSTDNAIVRWDGTTGKLVQNSAVIVTDDGNVGIGTTSPSANAAVHIQNSGYKELRLDAARNNNGALSLVFVKSRGDLTTRTATQSGDSLGSIVWTGWTSTGAASGVSAAIQAFASAEPTTTSMPGSLAFYTTGVDAPNFTRRMVISSEGDVGIGGSAIANYRLNVENQTPITTAGAHNRVGLYAVARPAVSSGVNASASHSSAVLVNTLAVDAHEGTIGSSTGMNMTYGIHSSSSATGVIDNAVGASIQPYAQAGTMGTRTSLKLMAQVGTGSVGDAWAIQSFDTAKSALAGALHVGSVMAPDASAVMAVTSTNKGFLPPRMTGAQVAAIASPADGLIVYDTTDNAIKLRADGVWTTLAASGTGALAAGVAGNVQFKGDDGEFAADTVFQWDNTNKRLGIGTATPSHQLHVAGEARFDNLVTITNNSGVNYTGIRVHSNGNSGTAAPHLMLIRGQGSYTSPTFAQSSDVLGIFRFKGRGMDYGADIESIATGNHSAGSGGADLRFYTQATGTDGRFERLRIMEDGRVLIGEMTATNGRLSVASTNVNAATSAAVSANNTNQANTNGMYHSVGVQSIARPVVASGVTNLGQTVGVISNVLSVETLNGTAASVSGVHINYGAHDGTPTSATITDASGIVIQPYTDGGTIGTRTSLYIGTPHGTKSTVNAAWAIRSYDTAPSVLSGALHVGAATAPNASAVFEVSSTTKGLLPPRMTTAQRTGIASPAAGLVVYDSQLNALHVYNGTSWVNMALSGASAHGPLGRVQFSDGAGGLLSDSGFYWDNVNKRLGIGTVTPTDGLHVVGNIRANATVMVGPGSVSDPSVRFISAPNTGIFKPGTDAMAFSALGVEVMRISAAGAVGIGIDTPTEKLDIEGKATAFGVVLKGLENPSDPYPEPEGAGGTGGGGSSTLAGLMDVDVGTPTDGQSLVYNASTSMWVAGAAVGGGKFVDGTNPLHAVYTAGNVGVGTTAPGQALDVVGSVTADAMIFKAVSGEPMPEGGGSGGGGGGSGDLTDGDKGDITVSGSGLVWTIDANAISTAKLADSAVTGAKIADGAVTFGKMQTVSSGVLLGRSAAGTGAVETLTLGSGLTLTGGILSASVGVTAAGSSGQVQFNDGSNGLAADSAFYWDNTNKRLGLSVGSPSQKLDVAGNVKADAFIANAVTGLDAPVGFGGGGWTVNGANVYKASGNVGIGTNNPQRPLHINGVARMNGSVAGAASVSYLEFYDSAGVRTAYVGDGSSANNDIYLLSETGAVRAQSGANTCLYTSGASWSCSSDARLKHDIETLDDSLVKLVQLRGVSYEWNDPAKTGKKHIGLIAQEVERVYPEMVTQDEDTGMKAIDYAAFVSPIIEAIKEIKGLIDGLTDKVAELFDVVGQLRAENAALKAQNADILKRLEALEAAR